MDLSNHLAGQKWDGGGKKLPVKMEPMTAKSTLEEIGRGGMGMPDGRGVAAPKV